MVSWGSRIGADCVVTIGHPSYQEFSALSHANNVPTEYVIQPFEFV
jgi:hypothetical protein